MFPAFESQFRTFQGFFFFWFIELLFFRFVSGCFPRSGLLMRQAFPPDCKLFFYIYYRFTSKGGFSAGRLVKLKLLPSLGFLENRLVEFFLVFFKKIIIMDRNKPRTKMERKRCNFKSSCFALIILIGRTSGFFPKHRRASGFDPAHFCVE